MSDALRNGPDHMPNFKPSALAAGHAACREPLIAANVEADPLHFVEEDFERGFVMRTQFGRRVENESVERHSDPEIERLADAFARFF